MISSFSIVSNTTETTKAMGPSQSSNGMQMNSITKPESLDIHFGKQHILGGTGVARAAVEIGGSSNHPDSYIRPKPDLHEFPGFIQEG